jgi:Glyoxalase-like domain
MLPVDHVTVAGADLRQMQVAFRRMGISFVYGGTHHRGGTQMALAGFADGSYLELLALDPNVHPQVAERNTWYKFLKGDAGPCAWAVCATDLEGELRRLRMAGIAASGPTSNGRQRPDGVRLQWEMANPGAGPAGSFFPFLIRDITERDLRTSPPGGRANVKFLGIARVVLAVRNLDAAVARYRQAYGISNPLHHTDEEFGAHLAIPGDAPIVLAQPVDATSWMAARLEQFGEAPCGVILKAADSERRNEKTQSRWFDLDISWLESGASGWRIGSAPKDSRP